MTSEMPPKMPLKVGGPPARNFIFQWADRDHRQYAILLPMEKSTHRITVIVACALAGAAALLCAAWWLAGNVKAARQAAERQELYKRLGIDADPKREFIPLPDILPHNAPAARLGQSLFVDRRLARSPYRMCGACHRLNEGGIDARALDGTLPRTAYNAVFADVFLHDGSVTGMPALVRHMIGSTNFCAGGSISNVAERLAADEKTRKMFQLAYTNGVTADNVVNALVEYQRTLFTSRRKFDHWCAGRTNALDAVQQRGFEVFRSRKCTDCHYGPALGTLKVADGKKVPGLRGISQRRAYLPDATTNIVTVIERMPKGDLEDDDRDALAAFLKTL